MNILDRFHLLCEKGNASFEIASALKLAGELELALEEARLASSCKAQAVLIIRNVPRIAGMYDWHEDSN
jgi:hypothetical protein